MKKENQIYNIDAGYGRGINHLCPISDITTDCLW